MGHAFQPAEKSPSRSPGGTSSHASMIMRQPTLTSQGLRQPKADPCACGGSCPRCREQLPIQKKLAISEPGDAYEREADRVADEVLAARAHPAVYGVPPRIQRFTVQATGQAEAAPASVDQVLASPGRPLEPALRQDMEQRFGHDFSRVRVHSGAAAGQSARDVSANAYTVGHNIVFGGGRFAPGTQEGRGLIAHELAHVVQQSGTDGIRLGQGREIRGLSPLCSTGSVDGVFINGPDKETPKPDAPKTAPKQETPPPKQKTPPKEKTPAPKADCPTDVQVINIDPITDSQFGKDGWMTGFGGVAYMEVSPSNKDWDGTKIQESVKQTKNTCGARARKVCSNVSGENVDFKVGAETKALGQKMTALRNLRDPLILHDKIIAQPIVIMTI